MHNGHLDYRIPTSLETIYSIIIFLADWTLIGLIVLYMMWHMSPVTQLLHAWPNSFVTNELDIISVYSANNNKWFTGAIVNTPRIVGKSCVTLWWGNYSGLSTPAISQNVWCRCRCVGRRRRRLCGLKQSSQDCMYSCIHTSIYHTVRHRNLYTRWCATQV